MVSRPGCNSAPKEKHFEIAKEYISENYLFYNVDKNSHESIGYCNNMNTQSSEFQVKNIFSINIGLIIIDGRSDSAIFTYSSNGIVIFIVEMILLIAFIVFIAIYINKKRKRKKP